MNDRSWFRLAVRVVGLIMMGLGAPHVLSLIGFILQTLSENGFGNFGFVFLFRSLIGGLGSCVQLGFGVYLFFFADGLIAACLRDTVGRCPACQYDFRGSTSPKCPECGLPVAIDQRAR